MHAAKNVRTCCLVAKPVPQTKHGHPVNRLDSGRRLRIRAVVAGLAVPATKYNWKNATVGVEFAYYLLESSERISAALMLSRRLEFRSGCHAWGFLKLKHPLAIQPLRETPVSGVSHDAFGHRKDGYLLNQAIWNLVI